jgi:glycosyltransferase A (GT-A) superfamily protein (DUF2064 family)
VNLHLLVVAKAPVPGRVKTRLCPPCTPGQAATVAAAALAQTLATVRAVPATRRTLLLEGRYPVPPGWRVCAQRGAGLGARLAHGLGDTAVPGAATLLVGMDTPQASPAQLVAVAAGLATADAVLGPAEDGGWWALALRDAGLAETLATVPMSRPDTAARTAEALRSRGARVAYGPTLRDVDTVADARHAAGLCPGTPFAAAVAGHVPAASAPAAPVPAAHVTVPAVAAVLDGRGPGVHPCDPR